MFYLKFNSTGDLGQVALPPRASVSSLGKAETIKFIDPKCFDVLIKLNRITG